MTELETPGHRALIAVPLTVFNAVIIGASSLYQATRSATVTITLTAAATVFASWTLWLGTRTRQDGVDRSRSDRSHPSRSTQAHAAGQGGRPQALPAVDSHHLHSASRHPGCSPQP